MTHTTNEWQGCYPSAWKGMIVPGAMSHPAKFSSRLIRRIYEHMLGEGWLRIGDRVIDPFGGVALGALEAMRHGLRWQGIELEAKFVDLGSQNIDLWNKNFSRMPHWGSAVLTQGDSRFVMKVLEGVPHTVISSPPYADTPINQTHMTSNQRGDPNNPNYRPSWKTKLEDGFAETKHDYGSTPGQLGSMPAGDFTASLSSPPYAETDINHQRNGLLENGREAYQRPYMEGREEDYGSTPGQLGAMHPGDFMGAISSPPFRQSEGGTPEPKPGESIDSALYARHAAGNSAAEGYGATPGNLANMDEPNGDFQGAIGSPPYTAMQVEKNSKSIDLKKQYDIYKKSGGGQTLEAFVYTQELHSQGYGHTDGQLSDLPAGDFNATVSSPPFEDTQGFHDKDFSDQWGPKQSRTTTPSGYGDTEGNMGNDSGETLWLAARQIVEQVYQVLAPGGHAVWVVKNYVKNKQIVPFCDQWRQLCEAVGFVTLHEHHASLVHHKGTSHTLEGGTVEHKTESKSFFRRLAEKKGSPRIDYETVLCMVKTPIYDVKVYPGEARWTGEFTSPTIRYEE